MPETGRPTRVRAWVRAISPEHWRGVPGRSFRQLLSKIARFGRDELKLGDKAKSSYDAAWGRVEGSIVGSKQAEALAKWQDAENRRIEARFRQATFDDSVEQQRLSTEKLRAETEKTQAETLKLKAEAEKLRAEASKVRVDMAIAFADRLVQAKVWLVPDGKGGYKFVPLPKNADISKLYPKLIPDDLRTIDPSRVREHLLGGARSDEATQASDGSQFATDTETPTDGDQPPDSDS